MLNDQHFQPVKAFEVLALARDHGGNPAMQQRYAAKLARLQQQAQRLN